MSEWQFIDAAPREPDGYGMQWLLGWNPEWNGPLPILWFAYGWVTPDQAECTYGEAGDGLYKILPTHWMPMPEPPKLALDTRK